jgi:hypothetical protein
MQPPSVGLLPKPGLVRNVLIRDFLRRLLQLQIGVLIPDFVTGRGCSGTPPAFELDSLSPGRQPPGEHATHTFCCFGPLPFVVERRRLWDFVWRAFFRGCHQVESLTFTEPTLSSQFGD